MNTNFKQVRQFAIATVVCVGLALAAGLVADLCGASARSDHRAEFPPAYYPMFLGLFVAVLLALVTACLFIAWLVGRFLRRGRPMAERATAPNAGPAERFGNSGIGGEPPSVR